MTFLVPFMLFGWVPLTFFLFLYLKPHHAVLASVIGGWLFLPMAVYNLEGIPAYSKNSAIALGLIIGGALCCYRQISSFQWRLYDLPMIVYCLTPVATSVSNALGIYDGLSTSFYQIVVWGVPYFAGRVFISGREKLHDLCIAIIVGGLLYVPLCLYEIRMSPQLSNMFFGFFPHSFGQHMRYGGFRPIIFMQHGLMVALWMAICSTVAFWLWKENIATYIKGFFFSLPLLTSFLIVTSILCKSVNGWFAVIAGCFSYYIFRRSRSNFIFLLLVLTIPLYIGLRSTDTLPIEKIASLAEVFVDEDRVESLKIRLEQENLFSHKAWERPLLGWGGYERGWPVDPDTDKKLIQMIDSTWLIAFSTFGLIGLVSLFAAMLLGPWCALRELHEKPYEGEDRVYPTLLSVVVIIFMIDALLNGMVNPVYILAAGSLVSWYGTKGNIPLPIKRAVV